MDASKERRGGRKIGQFALIFAVLVCMVFALISTHQLNESIEEGSRKTVLNYGNQVAARLHDLFERVDTSLSDLSQQIVALEGDGEAVLQVWLENYQAIWDMDAIGVMHEGGNNHLADGTDVVFENEISLRDVLSYSQKLNLSRQTIGGQEMLVFAKPCQRQTEEGAITGIFTAILVERLEKLLGDYGYSSDSFLVLTQSDGNNIWKQSDDTFGQGGNCFQELGSLSVAKGDSVLQMQTRMAVAMDGTISYARDGQDYYMAYVPLGVNYWYLLVSARANSIDLTGLARQHSVISALLMVAVLVLSLASIIYLAQRNRSITRYNQQLQVANQADRANKAKQAFLAKVSHDIRTPLNGVIGMLTLAKEEDDRDKQLGYLDKATVSARYLLGLLNDVLDMSQIESGKQKLVEEPVNMGQLLREVGAIQEVTAGEKGIAFHLDDSGLRHQYFQGDPLRLKQILTNLCSNAVKYTHEDGWIRLEAEELPEEAGGQLVFRVRDNGEGIAAEQLETIFKPFEQVSQQRQGGVGLGLSIVRSFVELMNGQITVESQRGAGSTFTVTLPLAVVEPPAEDGAEGDDSQDLHGVSVLLVEDNEINIEIARTLLERRGAQVTLARDGQQAVDAFCQSAPGTYHVILMDIQMPHVDGLEATRMIRASGHPEGGSIPILSMTANAFHEETGEMTQAGMTDFLYKPIEVETACACIRKWIGRK